MWANAITIAFVTLFAGLLTVIANTGFDQHWNFFIVWIICMVLTYGGILIFDDDGLDFL
jgi:hypothetical protein